MGSIPIPGSSRLIGRSVCQLSAVGWLVLVGLVTLLRAFPGRVEVKSLLELVEKSLEVLADGGMFVVGIDGGDHEELEKVFGEMPEEMRGSFGVLKMLGYDDGVGSMLGDVLLVGVKSD